MFHGIMKDVVYEFMDSSMRATDPVHLSRLDLRFLIILGEQHNACSST